MPRSEAVAGENPLLSGPCPVVMVTLNPTNLKEIARAIKGLALGFRWMRPINSLSRFSARTARFCDRPRHRG